MPTTCTARRSNGEPCRNRPMRGQDVCRNHGGASPQARAAAERRQLEGDARRALVELGVEPVADPFSELLQLAGEVLAWRKATAALVNQLHDIRYQGGSGEQLRAEVQLYERATDRAAHVLNMIARLNIEERLVAISEQQRDMVVGAVKAALDAAGVTGGQPRIDGLRAAARHLHVVPRAEVA